MSLLKRPDFERGRLLLVDCDPRTLAQLEKSLQRLGITVLALSADRNDAIDDVFAAVVELEHFASPNLLQRVTQAGVPVIALTPHETLSQIQRAIELGATALLNKPITQGSVFTTLMMAIGLHERLDAYARTISGLQQRLDARPLLAQALARLMVEHQINERDAYERLRSVSMQLNRSIDQLCADLAADHSQQSGVYK
ncbi:ANTAR domain-containing protein [Pseudomonas sp. CBSPBW29]|uniref:ANTAR domain-containing response regulator n=1 Tax=Pseudomonas sp. CBS TaxID=2971912 RepID=UPI0021ACEF86|nr:ANTAR domain-containing protein [Pseudomonas sp. CBS]WEL43522.1 ANTAR domain-containing protein [Pseudomonas sp. CBSPBW29]WEL64589.1 ANTAR domain-containing protein [Pseudomonas sp. CBSPGW29]WEL68058.1 ANTAR domain-containing protein [Pseudomonas sp. CBSPCGW29]WEL75079.1 ANTAR domain-containing protein [Pseudomonas sp. CBSPAW29]WEL80674.1 ANTAR domain-containing protein [Pseudomonas sp. CBSPCAW29]WEL89190.1 ANTAR domain-containing protein [Pseudomonas sp. CBSPCBW29]